MAKLHSLDNMESVDERVATLALLFVKVFETNESINLIHLPKVLNRLYRATGWKFTAEEVLSMRKQIDLILDGDDFKPGKIMQAFINDAKPKKRRKAKVKDVQPIDPEQERKQAELYRVRQEQAIGSLSFLSKIKKKL